MNIIEIINKKRLKQSLSYEELEYAFMGYLENKVESYQMSSLLMAICINGMTDEEIINLTDIFVKSGDCLDLSSIEGIKVDKHSTGGIGDKTTLIIAPIVASCGVKLVKMSGRGLGITGGTIDKLESIKGFKTSLSNDEFIQEIKDINMAISSQTDNLAPLDKKIYELRDVTGTTNSYALIAISVMSKKIACGADKILIDLKVGSGALINTKEEALKLADIMQKIGNHFGKETKIIISNMSTPLGKNIGNSLEVIEAMDVLKGNINSDLGELIILLASTLVSLGKNISYEIAKEEVLKVINDGRAYNKFLEFVKYQHGDISTLAVSQDTIVIKSEKEGTLKEINAKKIGEVSMLLGSGRQKKGDDIDHTVGIVLNKEIGNYIHQGDILCTLYVNKVKMILILMKLL